MAEKLKDEFSDSDDENCNGRWRSFTREEGRRYNQDVKDSDGFDVGEFPPDVGHIGLITPYPLDREDEDLQLFTQLAIDWHNKEKKFPEEMKLRLVDYVKWNVQCAGPFNFYITFKGKYGEHGEVKTFQALVISCVPEEDSYVDIFRVKPDSDSGGGSNSSQNSSPSE